MIHVDPDAAIIPKSKLRDHLLSPLHPIGRFMCGFFLELGYSQESWPVLERDVRKLLRGGVKLLYTTEFGQKLAASGQLRGPNGRVAGCGLYWLARACSVSSRLTRRTDQWPFESWTRSLLQLTFPIMG